MKNNIKKLIIVLLIILTGYYSIKNVLYLMPNKTRYEYGLLYTSSKDSIMAMYDKDGKFINDKKININGLTFGSFMDYPLEINDKIYQTAPVVGIKQQDFVAEIDKATLTTKKINLPGQTATFFCADEKFVYGGTTGFEKSPILKVDIHTNKVISKTEVRGGAILIIQEKDYLYVLSNYDDGYATPTSTLSIIDKYNMDVIDEILLEDITHSLDMIKVEDCIYISVDTDSEGKQSNIVAKVDLNNKTINNYKVDFSHKGQLHNYKNYIYVIEIDKHRDIVANRVARININTNEIEHFKLNGDTFISKIYDNELITSNGKEICIYDLQTLNLNNRFKVKEYPEDIFISIIKNQ